MKEENKYKLLAINANMCPKSDEPLIDKQCKGCEYYKDFELYNGQPCIMCSYFYDKV